jgi:zinc-ribbon domain
MPDYCTCGAELPPDALFCHKCGKPQREILVPETVVDRPPEVVPFTPPAVAEPPLNFRNPVAVRIALLTAVGATVLSFFLPFLNWIAAGFFAVFFYRRKTGSLLNVGAGVRLGWITGILMFVLWAVVFIPTALGGRLEKVFQEQVKNLPAQDPMVQQMSHFFQTGPGLAAILLFSLAALFVFITGLSMAGGALGAKMVGRN